MKLTDKQKELLTKYSIPFKDEYTNEDDFGELLLDMDEEMTRHVDKNDEPLEDFLIIEKLYDEIYYNW